MFHVEHSPLEEPSSAGRTFLHEPMHAWIDDLNRQQLGDRRHARLLSARDAHAHAGLAELRAGDDPLTINL